MNRLFAIVLDDETIIEFSSDDLSLGAVILSDEIDISLKQDEKFYYLMSSDCIQYNLSNLISLLSDALNNKLRLHSSIVKDIGYLWNENFNEKSDEKFIFNKIENINYWVGKNYILWETLGDANPNLTTWLYNDMQGNVVLEITPNYPWHCIDPEPGEKFISYEDFMSGYKPYLKKIITRDVAERMLDQAKQMLTIIESNEHDEDSEGH